MEVCDDSKDNDCDKLMDCSDADCDGNATCEMCTEADVDGYFAESGCGTAIDCNDGDAGIHPDASEVCGDGVDQDCDGYDLLCFKVNPTTVTIAPEGVERIMIEGGIPPYTASSPDTAVATIELNDDAVIVTGVGEGETSFTVADNNSESETVTVKVENSMQTHTNSLGMSFKRIPAGTFMMGSPVGELGRKDDEVSHEVTIAQDFYIQTTEVTQAQWEAVMGSNPSFFPGCGGNCPVENVSWNDAQEFIAQLNGMGDGTYRLPTEAEWEYAARAGSNMAFANGDISVDSSCDNDPNLDVIGFYCGNSCVDYEGGYGCSGWSPCESNCGILPVAQMMANDFGLYDMHGNVSEWCQDWYGEYPTEAVSDPTGVDSGSERVIRGGSWVDDAGNCRSANRSSELPDVQYGETGLRLVVIPD
jgi:formylglycine-generating enzyme required for sulfatase activity